MTKTRSQTRNITIKKEEEEDDKSTLGLRSIPKTRSSGRIAKRKSSIINNRDLPAQQVKVEEDTDTKSLLQSSSKYPKRRSRPIVSQAQINQLIDYIVNHNMTVNKAAREVNISYPTGLHYYKVYKNNPEKKIPVPRKQFWHPRKYYTQEQIGNLIRYIDTDKMTVEEASTKADLPYSSAHQYYTRYLNDPNHNIPILPKKQLYTQEQIGNLIGYIETDKMTIKEASTKADMHYASAHQYYNRYLNDPSHNIPILPKKQFYTQEQIGNLIRYIDTEKMTVKEASTKADLPYSSACRYYTRYLNDPNHNLPTLPKKQFYTQDQKNEFIGYIVNDKMSISAASKKAEMGLGAAQRFYHNYFKVQNPDIATPRHVATRKRCTQDQKDEFIGYVTNDKMSISAASKKAKMGLGAAQRFYHNYFKVQNPDVSTPSHIVTPRRFTQEQLNEAMYYITNDKMSITAASKKANVRQTTAKRRYRQYLKDHNMKVPVTKARKQYTQDQINGFLKYIVDDKMSVKAASEKANICLGSSYRYYHQYLNDQRHGRPN